MVETTLVAFNAEYAPEIRMIRNRVFTDEQQVDPDLDFDGQDRDALHVLIIYTGKHVGTGRMLNDGHIGRLAVLKEYRGKGLGAAMVAAVVKAAVHNNLNRVYLGAQKQAVGFYKKMGFSVYGEPYTEANIDHVYMEKSI